MSRLASLLAVLALLGVVGTSVLAVTDYRNQPSGVAGPERAFSDGQLVPGADEARFEVPAKTAAWTVAGRDTTIYYVDRQGEPSVGVLRPAIFDRGYCISKAGVSHRAFVGFSSSANARKWVDAISLDQDLTRTSRHTAIETAPYLMGGGGLATRSTSTITLSSPTRCEPPRISFTMLSWESGGNPVHLVLVRDVGARGVLSEETAEKILQSVG